MTWKQSTNADGFPVVLILDHWPKTKAGKQWLRECFEIAVRFERPYSELREVNWDESVITFEKAWNAAHAED